MNKLLTLSFTSLLFIGACKKDEEKVVVTPAPAPVEQVAPVTPPPVAPTPAPMEAQPVSNILATAKTAGNFTTLLAAIEAAGLTETLNGPGPFTVFAPTDEAFAKVPKADLDKLMADKAKLTKVLTYHVVSGNKMASDVTGMKEATTLNGANFKIDTTTGVKIDNATVVKADIKTSNGTIHAIDTVLMPKM